MGVSKSNKIWDLRWDLPKDQPTFKWDIPRHPPNARKKICRTSVSASTSTSRAWDQHREIGRMGFGHNSDWTKVSESGDYYDYKGFIVISTGLRPAKRVIVWHKPDNALFSGKSLNITINLSIKFDPTQNVSHLMTPVEDREAGEYWNLCGRKLVCNIFAIILVEALIFASLLFWCLWICFTKLKRFSI